MLKKQVLSSKSGVIDRSVPPRRVFRNLDLKRTVWKNLTNFNPQDGRLYVDQLFYRHTRAEIAQQIPDRGGRPVGLDGRRHVQCAILASIFATLPRVVVSLVAFDTSVVDLTSWAADPFESLMRTNLGGGNDGPKAMAYARTLITDPRRTTMVWISDFFEFHNDRPLFDMIKAVKQSGIHFIPVGSVSGTGYFSVNEWFRKQLKGIGVPLLTGNVKKLIVELKKQTGLNLTPESSDGQAEVDRRFRARGRAPPGRPRRPRSSASPSRSSTPTNWPGSARSTTARARRRGSSRRGWSGSSSSVRRQRTGSTGRSRPSSSATRAPSSARSSP